jgi:RNA polymerase sigma factor (sigma-70 family)
VSVAPHNPVLSVYFAKREALRRTFAAKSGAEAAEDLIQELYLRLMQVPPSAEIANADAYLYRLAFNLMIDQKRSSVRRQLREDAWTSVTGFERDGAPVAQEPGADRLLIAKQDLACVLAIVGRLPEQTQRVFRLHKLEELSYREVAVRLGITVSTVEKHMTRALQRLLREAAR